MSVEALPTNPADELRRRGVGTLLHMGRCAPTVMPTMRRLRDRHGTTDVADRVAEPS